MATEKKRRGESGQKNAANKPFRLNGRPPDWAAQRVGAYNVGPKQMGAHLARAAIGTILVQRLGFFPGFEPSHVLDDRMSKSLDRCPVASAVFDGISG